MGREVRVVMAGQPSPAVSYRRATAADIEGQHAVFVAAEGELLERHGFAWPAVPPVEAIGITLRHLLRHDGERCFVAEAGGRVVGYSAGLLRGEAWHLAALFIHPGYQGRGVGRTLMELAMTDAPARRMTISDSIQPISNALYAKHGLLPATPILGFQGTASTTAPSGLAASAPDPAGLALLDRAAYGFDRAVDHAFWASHAMPTLWLRDGAPAAYSYRWPNSRIGPLAGLDPESAASALRGELARRPDASMIVPGTSRSLVRTALESGLRLGAPPGLLLLSDGVEPPRSLAIASYGLM